MSGIIGSFINHRGSGVVAKMGTDGHSLNSGGAGIKALTESVSGGLTHHPGFFTGDGPAQTTGTRICTLSTEVFDIGSNYSLSSSVITVANTGYYMVEGGSKFSFQGLGAWKMHLYIDGSEHNPGNLDNEMESLNTGTALAPSSWVMGGQIWMIDLTSADQTVSIYGSGTVQNDQYDNYLTIWRVGDT